MDWQEMIEGGVYASGQEALEWELGFDGVSATVAMGAAVNFLFRNTAHRITPADLGKAYLDAATDLTDKKPRDLGKVIYQYAAKSVYGSHE